LLASQADHGKYSITPKSTHTKYHGGFD